MEIAILGWGSLIWDPRTLRLAGDWQTGGPVLRIEFSRISDDGRLTLVIDEQHGVDVETRFALSGLSELDLAIKNLQEREGARHADSIGYACRDGRQSKQAVNQHPKSCANICAWLAQSSSDAVIWTAIGPRFETKAKNPFSVDAAISYLGNLREPTRTLARDYILKAPAEVTTPVRLKAEELFRKELQPGS